MGVFVDNKTRTRWTEEERTLLARYVVEHAGKPVLELYDDEVVELVREGMILVLGPGRDRVIQGISQIRGWIRSEMADVLREPDEEEDENEPPPYIDPPQEDDPEAPPDRDDEPGDPVPVGAPETQPEPSYGRLLRRLSRVRAEQTRTADELASLVDTILEVLPNLKRMEPPPMLPKVAILPNCHLYVAVAGLRKDQQETVEREVGDMAEIDFVDVTRKRARHVGGCDILIATRWSGRTWTQQAKRLYGDHVVEANSASEVIRIIREIAKSS